MELNTSESRINQEVKEIFENEKLKYAIEEVTKSYRYQIIKLADAAEYLGPAGFKKMVEALDPFLKKIEEGRVKDGKSSGNDYIVINHDELYINDIIKVLAANGHWNGEVPGEFKPERKDKMTNYKVFSMDGCDYVAAKSEEEAKKWYEQFMPREDIEECFEGEVSLDKQIVISKGELTESEYDRVIKILGNVIPEQEESFKVSLNDWLKVMLSTPTDEPFIIASTEY